MPADEPDRATLGRLLLGARVRARRTEAGLLMAALAEQAGVTETFISQFERGNKLPTLSTLDAIATALGTTVADLLQGVYPWGAAVPPNERPAPPPDGRSLRTRPPRS